MGGKRYHDENKQKTNVVNTHPPTQQARSAFNLLFFFTKWWGLDAFGASDKCAEPGLYLFRHFFLCCVGISNKTVQCEWWHMLSDKSIIIYLFQSNIHTRLEVNTGLL